MDKREIKEHLSGYRPELYRDDDPQIAEALQAAKDDPELSAWLSEQVEYDRQLTAQLQSLATSSQAKERLCDEMSQASNKRRLIPEVLFAIAAMLLISAVLIFNSNSTPETNQAVEFTKPKLQTLREELAHFVTQPMELDHRSEEVSNLKAWLDEKEHPTFNTLPGPVVHYKGMGCKTIDWHGHQVSLICLVNPEGQVVHFFNVDKSVLDSDSLAQLNELLVFHDRQTGGLIQGDKVLLYVGSMPDVEIGELLLKI